MEITQREYNRTHGFTPGGDNPSRAGQIRRRGGGLGAEIARDGAASPAPSAEQPVYNTPDKNMHAAQAAAEELNRLEAKSYAAETKRVASCSTQPPCRDNPRYANAPELLTLVVPGNDWDGPRTRPSPPPRPAGTGTPGPPMPGQAGWQAATAAQPATIRLQRIDNFLCSMLLY
ncbi:hypothetical protein QYE76_054160 [Lolium multiflorum]|uniref:Uncharacterized protein n=1 Tax=Lolium multiflorum TaxID=4521 RepID=A0AAD8SX52_LOLMU|nr:hypothetical protein QYE76_054160 [Lolium multiflorum]